MSFGFWGYRRIVLFPRSPRAEMYQPSGLGCLLILLFPLLLLVSTYLAWWELRFLIQGRTTDATVESVQKIPGSRGRLMGGSYLDVRYTFKDDPAGLLRT